VRLAGVRTRDPAPCDVDLTLCLLSRLYLVLPGDADLAFVRRVLVVDRPSVAQESDGPNIDCRVSTAQRYRAFEKGRAASHDIVDERQRPGFEETPGNA